jgi:UDP:flavonoid glycosyltransferase YjiC (YdhE family)
VTESGHGPGYDVVLASDLRFPGGTSASLAEEVRVQAAAGYRTGLLQVFGPLVATSRAVNPLLRRAVDTGAADLLPPRGTVCARLAVLRHPAVFAELPEPAPRLEAEQVVLVANSAARGGDGEVFYDVRAVDEVVHRWTGVRPLWAPIGPLVRPDLERAGVQVREQDWVNLIDVDAWAADRSAFRDDVPVIGRHSRPQAAKWPSSAAAITAAYPTDGSVRVRVLGGAAAVRDVLGTVPERWEVEEFGERHPRDFLADVDFFVYYHHEHLVEAFGRTVMEALASGAVAVLPPGLRASFGDAAVYAEPGEAMAVVRRLHADRAAYEEQSRRGQDWVRERHGAPAHLERLTALVGPPPTTAPAPPSAPRRTKDVVLFVSSNGAGMGHLTRLLAMARRAPRTVQPLFLSLSQAVPVVGREGFPFEYFPSRGAMGVPTREWNPLFAIRFRQALREHHPAAVVFDGTWPYLGLMEVRPEHPDVRFVWSRRGMWRSDTPPDQLDKSPAFDLVVEPGEYAAEYDRGPTSRAGDALRVAPVTYLDSGDLLPREQAAAELGLDPSRPAVLVTLGAGNINDLSSDLGVVVEALRRHPEVQVAVTQPPIAGADSALDASVVRVQVYPLSRYLRAFDAAIAASGYNSFHELVGFGVPSLYLPNLDTRTDDQEARARFAADRGLGLMLREVHPDVVGPAVAELLDPHRREAMAQACRDVARPGGAAEAMAAVARLLAVRA